MLSFALQATLLLTLTLIVTAMLRHASAAWRHRVLVLGLAATLALPALSMITPDIEIEPNMLAPVALEQSPAEGLAGSLLGTAGARRASTGPTSLHTTTQIPWATLAAAAWLLGIAMMLGRILFSHLRAFRIARRAERSHELDAAIDNASAPGSPPIRVGYASVSTPMAIGVVRSTVVLPREAASWDPERLRLALLHELAHVARRDTLWLLLGHLVQATLFWNPLTWLAVRRLRAEAEVAADDRVLKQRVSASAYASLLLDEVRRRRVPVPSAALGMAGRSEATRRIEAVLDERRPRTAPSRVSSMLATAAVVVVAAAVACVGPEREAPAPNRVDDAELAPPDVTGSDPRVAAIVDTELQRIVSDVSARVVRAVVVDPRNGRVLAIRSHGGEGDAELVAPLPPASTLKPLLVGAGLEAGLEPTTVIETGEGTFSTGDHVIRDWMEHGTLDVTQVVARSSNIGAVKIYEQVGAEATSRFLVGLGLDRRPELDIERAERGHVPEEGTLAIALGHEVSTSPVQLAIAYAAIANGGTRIEASWNGEGARERVMSVETATQLRTILEHAVNDEHATGRNARIEGVRVAGKTGTGLLLDATGSRAIFIGMFPADDPRYVVYVDAEVECEGVEHYGGSLAAPAFARIGARLLSEL